MEDTLNTIIHENTHAWQSLDKSTLHPDFVKWAKKVYTNDGTSRLYWDAITEQEARYVGKNAARKIMRALGL